MKTEIFKINNNLTDSILKKAISCLENGFPLIFPTETVYGIAIRADKKEWVEKIFELKKRDGIKPLTLHTANISDIEKYAVLPAKYKNILSHLPGPLTLILKRNEQGKQIFITPENKEEYIGFRVPDNLIANLILKSASFPIVATSVNFSGEKSMTEIIEHPLISCAGIVIDNGETHYKNGSTIIKLSENTKPQLLREGAIKINPEEL